MQLKRIFSGLIIVCIVVFLNACVTSGGSSKSLSDVKKADLYLQMGVRYLDLNKIDTAKAKLDVALALAPRNEEVHNALGVLHERMGEIAVAAQHYKSALGINDNNYSIKNNYGRFLCERGKYADGVGLLKQSLAMPLNNRKWLAYTNLGYCELKNTQQQAAETNFRQALQLNSRFLPALKEMQKISYRKGKFLSARAFLERYLAGANHTSETLWYAVQTERALGNKTRVEQYRESLFTLFPASKEAEQLKTAVKRE